MWRRQCSMSSAARHRGRTVQHDHGLDVLREALVRNADHRGLLTAGWASRQFSTSAGKMFSAPDLIIRVIVPRKLIVPSGSRRPRSVVCHQPPRKRWALISGRFQ